MATPQSTTSHDDASGPKKLEQITFRFCSECSNMLYPKENEDAHKLQFTCRTCQYTEEAASSCVFRNMLNNSAGETAGVTQDVGSDPTVSHRLPDVCLYCGLVLLCRHCSQPATHASLARHEDRSPRALATALFVLALAGREEGDPFAEYDEEPQDVAAADEGYATADSSARTPGPHVEWRRPLTSNPGQSSPRGLQLGRSLDAHAHVGVDDAVVIHI